MFKTTYHMHDWTQHSLYNHTTMQQWLDASRDKVLRNLQQRICCKKSRGPLASLQSLEWHNSWGTPSPKKAQHELRVWSAGKAHNIAQDRLECTQLKQDWTPYTARDHPQPARNKLKLDQRKLRETIPDRQATSWGPTNRHCRRWSPAGKRIHICEWFRPFPTQL